MNLPCSRFSAISASAANAATISGQVTGPDGQPIPQAVVFVESPVAGEPEAASTPPSAEMDQINKTFVPHVLPVAVGTRVRFPNSDQIHHHVYSFSRTKTFELPLYKGENAPPVLFDKPGVVKIGCNIHDWMSGIILVLPTRHFAITEDDGPLRAVRTCRRARIRSPPGMRRAGKKPKTWRSGRTGGGRTWRRTSGLSLEIRRARPGQHGVRGGTMKWWARSSPAHQDLHRVLRAGAGGVLMATLGFTQIGVVSREAERTLRPRAAHDWRGIQRAGEGARRAPAKPIPCCWRAISR